MPREQTFAIKWKHMKKFWNNNRWVKMRIVNESEKRQKPVIKYLEAQL